MGTIPKPNIACQRRVVKSKPFETQNIIHETRFPSCFEDHNAPQSVVTLFTEWVAKADETDGGVIAINRQRQRYNATTVDKTVKWLVSHRLLFLVERGGGRGNGNRYLVRWSFSHETLSTRQNAVNHSESAKTLHLYKYAREEVLKLSEESLKTKKHSFDKSKTSHDILPVDNSKRERFTAKNKQRRQLRSEKATRWVMARLREATADEDALQAAAQVVRRDLAKGRVWIGPELKRWVAQLADYLRDLNDGDAWPESRRDVFSFVGYHTQQALFWVLDQRRNEAEYEQRERERQEAQAHPVDELLQEAGVSKVSDLVRAIVRGNPLKLPSVIEREGV